MPLGNRVFWLMQYSRYLRVISYTGGTFFQENKIIVKQMHEKLTDVLSEDQDRTVENSQVSMSSHSAHCPDVQMAMGSNTGPSGPFEHHFKFVNSIYLLHSSQTANDFYLLGQYFGIA